MKKISILFSFYLTSLFAFEDLTLENFADKTFGKNVILDFYAKK